MADLTIDVALAPLREMLASDGYVLHWSAAASAGIEVRIDAGPDACSDCLVPQPVLESIVAQALVPTGFTLDRVELPADGH